ncbi:hypothetical protein BS17DRAFT_777136 [Gyrodon lividus]|nr:hypothetical protein BS17DRAFT_777136 [Gyrodon lividus]
MPVCRLCPGRSFVDDNAVRMHKESKHWYCQTCDKDFSGEQALDQHTDAKHRYSCDTCSKVFYSQQALDQHQADKHPPLFECQYCEREFTTDEGRLAHEKAKHDLFECQYCDREFNSLESRQQHEQAKHIHIFQCSRCNLNFHTKYMKDAHEKSHNSHSMLVSSSRAAQPQAVTSYPPPPSTSPPPIDSNLIHVSDAKGQSATSQCSHVEVDESSDDPANPQTSEDVSSSGEKEITHSNDDGLSTDAPQDVIFDSTICMQPCTCTICQRKPASPVSSVCDDAKPCICSICHRRPASPLSSVSDAKPDDVEDDAMSICSGGQDDPADNIQVTYHCISCGQVFDTDKHLRGHLCTSRGTIFRPHCTFCYTQFDDESSLLKHLEEDRVSFPCQLCHTLYCSDDTLQNHILGHPTCHRCGKSFIDDLALCSHVESEHPAVVCWDCDGPVVEQDSLELHYADSPEHPSCVFCGVGKRTLTDMVEHLKNQHATELHDSTASEIEVSQANVSVIISGTSNGSGDEEPVLAEKRLAKDNRDDLAQEALGEPNPPSPTSVEEPSSPIKNELHEPCKSSLTTELSLSPISPSRSRQEADISSTLGTVHGQVSSELARRRYASPSPTPCEHGSDGSSSQLLTHHSEAGNITPYNKTRFVSPRPSARTESFYDISSPLSSTHSIEYISAGDIPEYVRENRAYLVATSAASPPSGHNSVQLPSSSPPRDSHDVTLIADGAGPSTSMTTQRLHCRVCLREPCEETTATICGHIFCKRCITQAIVDKSECPVCNSTTLLYCLLKLDLSV